MNGCIPRPLEPILSYSVRYAQPEYFKSVILDWVYQFRALPFEVLSALVIFTRVMGVTAIYALRLGVQVHMYLDDCLSRSLGRVLCSGSRSSFWIYAGTWDLRPLSTSHLGPSRTHLAGDSVLVGTVPLLSCGGSVMPPEATPSQFLRRPALTALLWMES